LINALLGAMGKGDIGTHFPDSAPEYEGISSKKMLAYVLRMMRQAGFRIVNGDVTLIAQRPRLSPHYEKMRRRVAALLQIPRARLNIKAGTPENLGDLGRAKGMAATAVVLLQKTRRSRGAES
jgi:2-C-methyl-D-erythritol 2,4-cyclodiphosphate synthase